MKRMAFFEQPALQRARTYRHLGGDVVTGRLTIGQTLHDELSYSQYVLGRAQLADALLGRLIMDCSHLRVGGQQGACGIALGKRHGQVWRAEMDRAGKSINIQTGIRRFWMHEFNPYRIQIGPGDPTQELDNAEHGEFVVLALDIHEAGHQVHFQTVPVFGPGQPGIRGRGNRAQVAYAAFKCAEQGRAGHHRVAHGIHGRRAETVRGAQTDAGIAGGVNCQFPQAHDFHNQNTGFGDFEQSLIDTGFTRQTHAIEAKTIQRVNDVAHP